MNLILSPDNCIKLLRKNGCSNRVIKHCMAVRDVAVKIAINAHADVELVEAGALLHDIGRSKTHGIFHAVEGVKIAQKLGLSKDIINIIERHIGAGIPRDEAVRIGLPPKDYLPLTLEEKIVCHADSLINNCSRQNIENEIEKALKEDLSEYAKRLKVLHKELSDICGININYI